MPRRHTRGNCKKCLLNTFKSNAALWQVGETWLALATPTIPRSEAMPPVNLLGALDIVGYVVVPQVCNRSSIHLVFVTQPLELRYFKGEDRHLLSSWRYICLLTTSKQRKNSSEQNAHNSTEDYVTLCLSFAPQTLSIRRIYEVKTLGLAPLSVKIKEYYRAMVRQKIHYRRTCLENPVFDCTWISLHEFCI